MISPDEQRLGDRADDREISGRSARRENLGQERRGRAKQRIYFQSPNRRLKTPIVHTRREFVCCLEEQFTYIADAEIYRQERGDSLLFEACPPAPRRDPPYALFNKLARLLKKVIGLNQRRPFRSSCFRRKTRYQYLKK